MVQGGGFDANYADKSPPARRWCTKAGRPEQGGPRNVVGTVAMARTNDPQSATAQFFINVKDNAFLDPTPIPLAIRCPFRIGGRVYENTPGQLAYAAVRLHVFARW